MKHLHLDLIKATEQTAISAYKLAGHGDKKAADLAAVNTLREQLNNIDFSAIVKVSEGEKDESHMLTIGGCLGKNTGNEYELCADPIDGTTQTSKLGYEAMAVVVLTEKDSIQPTNCYYMHKLAVGPKIAKHMQTSLLPVLSITDPVNVIIPKIAKILEKDISEVIVCVLDRPRHNNLVKEIRETGARVKFIPDCDLSAAIATCIGDIDILLGIGGQPEAYLSAAALKCLGGFQQCLICDKNANIINDKVLEINDLIVKDAVFAATAITDSNLLGLKGVKYKNNKVLTQSLLISKNKTHKIHSYNV
jgi:fructose-1,6-bisphosphatase II